jgi:hypothetical protein
MLYTGKPRVAVVLQKIAEKAAKDALNPLTIQTAFRNTGLMAIQFFSHS